MVIDVIMEPFKKVLTKFYWFLIKQVSEQGAYYVPFGVYGIVTYTTPYFIWSDDINYMIPIMEHRIMASTLCFIMLVLYFSGIRQSFIRNRVLPIYWYLIVLYTLPFVSSYTLFIGQLKTSWIVNFALSIFVLSLLVDWINFIVFIVVGTLLGYLAYVINSGTAKIFYEVQDLFLAVYVHVFSTSIGVFILYQRSIITKRLKEAHKKTARLNRLLERRVAQRTSKLQKALDYKTDFLNNISHEVRTPLQGIIGISGELVRQWINFSEKERFHYAKIIADSGSRLINLVSNLLDLSKFDSGKMLFDFENNDIIKVVNNVLDELMPLSISNKTKIKLLILDKISEKIHCDGIRISQVMRNLLTNALKYTKHGDIKVYIEKVSITSWNQEEKIGVKISVQDNGIGIPESELNVIFQPFLQSSKTKTKAGGTGLGLSICSEIIRAHNGKIWAENNVEGGASFFFILPIRKIKNKNKKENLMPTYHLDEKVDIIAQKQDVGLCTDIVKYNWQNQKLLLVDDESVCLISGKLIFISLGFEVLTADNGSSALAVMEKEQDIKFVLLDLMMPDMSGLEVLLEMKKNKRLKDIPVILQSGASDTNELEMALEAGAVVHIMKPYDHDQAVKILIFVEEKMLNTD